ncbi:hypothetical protein [Sanguibacter sp. HDW7]|nr:hypothetical protein [Sanguibacter sp. HDW7]QIK83127.1 hypothetical protein G7063_05395 [Sanguibacter sp. HDW7]
MDARVAGRPCRVDERPAPRSVRAEPQALAQAVEEAARIVRKTAAQDA